jgi:RNA polymerase sigma-70 factor, ECF subfamily
VRGALAYAATEPDGEVAAAASGTGSRALSLTPRAATTIEQLYDGYAARVHAMALRVSGDARIAETITQEVFVRAWKALPSFRGDSSIATWLHRIAMRAIIDHFRSDAAWTTRFELLDSGAAAAAPAQEARVDDRIDLERAIARLPTGARAVLVMHDIEGFTYQEIAAALAVAVGTVRSQLHRARRLLMEILDR